MILSGINCFCKKCGKQDFVLYKDLDSTWTCVHCGNQQTVRESADMEP